MSRYYCIACHARHDDYSDFCDRCHRGDTLCEAASEDADGAAEDESPGRGRALRLASISPSLPPKVSTGRPAWDRVLGGGLTRPSSVLVQGPKGVGKSSSALRIADHVSQATKRPALYGASEMPKEHVRRLGDLLGLRMTELYINDSGHLEDMILDIESLRPTLIVWDSIQRFSVGSELGEIPLRQTVTRAIRAGNRVHAASLLLSQVTKENRFVGRSSIGHDVDVLLELGRAGGRRKDRGLITVACLEKNRFAPTPISATETLHDSAPNRSARAR